MKIIGLIGGIGSGKSKVLEILKDDFNAYIIAADHIGHEILLKGEKSYQLILDYFGDVILGEDNEIDRKKLGNIVFSNEEALEKLTGMTHPYIYKRIEGIIKTIKADEKYDLIVLEASILVESGFSNLVQEIWFVYCDLETRMMRLLGSRSLTKEKILDIVSRQHNDEFYRAHADVIIDNSNALENTYLEIEKEIRLLKGDLL